MRAGSVTVRVFTAETAATPTHGIRNQLLRALGDARLALQDADETDLPVARIRLANVLFLLTRLPLAD
jgi:hypothetical protein